MSSEHSDILFAFFWVYMKLLRIFKWLWPLILKFITSSCEFQKSQIRYQNGQQTTPKLVCHFYSCFFNYLDLLCLIIVITLVTLGSLKINIFMCEIDTHIKEMLIEKFDMLFAFFWVHMILLYISKVLVKRSKGVRMTQGTNLRAKLSRAEK